MVYWYQIYSLDLIDLDLDLDLDLYNLDLNEDQGIIYKSCTSLPQFKPNSHSQEENSFLGNKEKTPLLALRVKF